MANRANTYTTLLLLFLSPLVCAAQIPHHHAPFFVFGDSLYDGGMTLYIGIKGAAAEFWPYGYTFFRKPAGRYSDGRLIPDFIAEYAGRPFLQPYLLPGLNNYTNGINFASAGACALVETRPNTINIKMQVDYFLDMVPKLKEQVGDEQAKKLLSKAVYLFNIGGNDYVELLNKNLKKPALSPSKKKNYINQVIGNITTHIKTIYNQGGRKFAFQNLGPIGCMPSLKYMLGFKGTCAQEPLELAQQHNAATLAVMKRLEKELPGLKYSIYDFYSSLYVRVHHGDKYGFKETKTACCGSGRWHGDFTCQKPGQTFSVCSTPNEHLWFDAAHPTDKANQQFSKEFWSGDINVVAPYNLKTLFET